MTKRKIAYWVIPPEHDAEFVACMEEVLDTYAAAYDPQHPVLCMDEQPIQLLEETLDLLNVGGLYIVDDLLPLPSWGEAHLPRVSTFIRTLEHRQDLRVTKLNWSTGILIAAKTG